MNVVRRIPTILLAVALPAAVAACGGDEAAPAAEATGDAAVADASGPDTDAEAATRPGRDFEGTLQQVEVQLGADAIRSLAGSDDPSEVLRLSPDRVLEAVRSGEVEARTIRESRIEIQGRRARLQAGGEPGYTIVDGERGVVYVVDPQERTIMVMDPEEIAEAAAGRDRPEPEEASVERVGTRTIRGYEATGYRIDMGDQLLLVWMSEEMGESIRSYSESMFELGAQLQRLGMGGGRVVPPEEFRDAGAAVRTVMVHSRALRDGSGARSPFGAAMPAYLLTEFYELEPGSVPDERFALPEGYERRSFGEMIGRMGQEVRQMMEEARQR